MAEGKPGTKEALLQSAGELFAEYGFNGASTRAIADKAGANMAAINYHFGGKEQLYLEALRCVFSEEKCTWGNSLEQALELTEGGASVREALRQVICERLRTQLGGDRPLWHSKLIIRSLLEPSAALKALSNETFAPDYEKAVNVARAWNPEFTREEASLWANSLFGHEMLYTLGRAVLLEFEQWDDYPDDYLARVADHIARLMAAALQPQGLDSLSEGER